MAQLTLVGFSLLGILAAAPGVFWDQLARIGIALLAQSAAWLIPVRVWLRAGPALWAGALALLLAVLIFGQGPEGVRRWFDIAGFNLQPSELAKLALVVYLASLFERNGTDYPVLNPVLALGIAAGLVAAEPNFSAAAFLLLTGLVLLVVIGVPARRLWAIGLAASLIAVSLQGFYLERFSYVGERFLGYWQWITGQGDPLGASYQILRAWEAMQAGGIWGQGVLSDFPVLPAASTDMIFASIVYATGWLGGGFLVLAYLLIVARGLQIARASRGGASALAIGISLVFGLQAGLNLGVVLGVFPVGGIALPFVSYGGSGILMFGVAFGLLQAIARQNKPRRKRRSK